MEKYTFGFPFTTSALPLLITKHCDTVCFLTGLYLLLPFQLNIVINSNTV
jgi:hypothetical protein